MTRIPQDPPEDPSTETRWRRFVGEYRRGEHEDYTAHWRLYQDLAREANDPRGPFPVWWPGERETSGSNASALLAELGLDGYRELHRWSVANRELFWQGVIARLGLHFDRPPERVLDPGTGVEDPVWLPGARFNIVDSCFQAPADEPAIIAGGEADAAPTRVTYGELERLVNRIANGLREHGFVEGDAIVLYMPMTVDCVAAYLGIVRAGCRVVSVADSFSAAELRRRMEISGARTIICLAGYDWAGRRIDLLAKVRTALDGLSGEARAIVIPAAEAVDPAAAAIDRELPWDEMLSHDTEFASVMGQADTVTNILFSSGTTGDPKAIPWTQLTPIKCAMDGHYHQDIRPGDVVAWPTNIGWMMGPWLIYATLLNRASMALYGGAPHSMGFTDFVASAGITMLGLVPALVRAWRSKSLVAPDAWPGIRVFSSTGEVSNPEDYLWLMSRSGYRAPVIEYLGGTEIGGGHITGSVLQPASPSAFTTPALGLDFALLGDDDLPVGPGEMGELFLIPPSVGLSQVLLNKEHHRIYYKGCPRGPGGEILRRHGDQFNRLGAGYFRAQGRADDTMNLGGIKVGSIELEEVINEHPGVFESAAIAVQPSGGGADQLVVHVVPAPGAPTGQEALDYLSTGLRRRVARELNPLFKIHRILVLDALPRTASNKVMRRELRDRFLAGDA